MSRDKKPSVCARDPFLIAAQNTLAEIAEAARVKAEHARFVTDLMRRNKKDCADLLEILADLPVDESGGRFIITEKWEEAHHSYAWHSVICSYTDAAGVCLQAPCGRNSSLIKFALIFEVRKKEDFKCASCKFEDHSNPDKDGPRISYAYDREKLRALIGEFIARNLPQRLDEITQRLQRPKVVTTPAFALKPAQRTKKKTP